NHHVAYRCLAALDGTDEHKGVMNKGYVAKSRDKEIPCPGYDLLVVDKVQDITAAVGEKVPAKLKGHKRFEALKYALEDLETECQSDGREMFCDAEPLDGGRWFHMVVYRLIKDVRLVYAPQKDIGKYGGDVDNWRYPRHTGDFTFLRAYVDKAGKGAPHSTDNVPFTPQSRLEVSTEGIAKDDIVLVLGFPARTKRNYPAASARFASQTDMPARKELYGGLIELIEKLSTDDDLTRRRYQGLMAGLHNATKYYDDSMAGFAKWKIVEKREARDAVVAEKKGGKVLPKINRIYKRYTRVYPKHFMLVRLTWLVKSLGTAYDIVRWNQERTKEDREREDEDYKSKNVYKVFGAADRLDDQVTITAEKALLVHVIREAEKLPPKNRIKAIKKLLRIGKKLMRRARKEAKQAGVSYDEYYAQLTGSVPTRDKVLTAVDLAFAYTVLLAHSGDDVEKDRALYQRRRLLYNDAKDAKRFKDPLLAFARELAKELTRLEKGPYRAVEETFDAELRPSYAELIEAAYPDANFQIRMSHGTVDDYTATKDGVVHRYVTDLAGVLAKDKGEFPFKVPGKLKKAAQGDKGRFVDKNIDDVPINFTCTLDTTGGNSGSPVLDGKGRLVGLLFDGTPESVLSDWQFLQDEQRSIVMDIRYALFLADKVHGASGLLQEVLGK
ncbi:MAG: S46 family peptidase, partial [Deltaproteobacteria bacterium]|nr:S46 family peptidase [Deltaproteobacteria bacterium]